MRKTIAHYCFVFGASALFFFFSNITIAAIIFLFHGSESIFQEWLSAGITIVFVAVACRRTFKHSLIAALMVLIGLVAVFWASLAVAGHFYDISYDGQTYQQEGVIQLAQGWNPVYTNLDPAVIGADQKWIDYYPKGIWTVESYFYLLTGNLQDAKGMNLILVVTALALVYAALADADVLGPWSALIASILIACNPVNISQSLNFYVDGDLYSVLICLVAIGISFYATKRPLALTASVAALALLINIKFTGLVYAGLVLIVFFILYIRKLDGALFLRWLYVSTAAVVLGVLFIGASPYITNTIRYQAPFYPLFGKGAIDLKPYNVPGNFINKSAPEIFVLSFFTQSGQVRDAGTTAMYKIPFTYNTTELDAFRYPDPEEGGFGPLFGGILIVIFAAWLVCWFITKGQSGRRAILWGSALVIIFIIITCIVNPIASLARYVPQAYLIAIVPVIALLMIKKPFATVSACAVIALLLFNGYLIGNSYFSYEAQTTAEIGSTLSTLAEQSQTQPILIHFNEFKSDRIMFAEAGINYINVVNIADCKNPTLFLPENTTQLCQS
jgi:hypothetical protein